MKNIFQCKIFFSICISLLVNIYATFFGRSKKKKVLKYFVLHSKMVYSLPFYVTCSSLTLPQFLSPSDLPDDNSFPTKVNPVVCHLTTL